MKIEIEIECETIGEFELHLKKMLVDIDNESHRLNLNPNVDELPESIDLDDDNCYGSHTVKIIND